MFRKIKDAFLTPARLRVSERITALQRGCADHLQVWSERLSRRMKLTLLVIFCCVGVTASLLVVRDAIRPGKRQGPAISPIRPPRHITETGEIPLRPNADDADDGVLRQITLFHQYLDSLRQSPAGGAVYDSLCRARPGLLDSLNLLEKFYHLKK